MPGIAQHSVNALAAQIEPLAVRSWPAPHTLEIDGWLLRFGKGFSSRLNSVSTLDYSGSSLDHTIAAAEAAYRAHGLPPQFQISCATRPADDWAAVYVMRTTPAHRRRGHGRRVLGALAAWALTRNARRLYLQVDAANTPARELYARAGFRDAYRYLHYLAPQA